MLKIFIEELMVIVALSLFAGCILVWAAILGGVS